MTNRSTQQLIRITTTMLLIVITQTILGCSSDTPLQHWHKERLTEEFSAAMTKNEIRSFEDYLALEQRLFRQLDEQIYAKSETGPEHMLERYSSGSMADPRNQQPDWNHSFELPAKNAVGGILLLHGMSDSPYSLRALGQSLNEHGYQVLGLRLPGHGTVPSGLRYVRWQDMAAAVSLAMQHLVSKLGQKPVHVIGYSTGAPLAMDLALNSLLQQEISVPKSLVFISPAIRVHPVGALARFKNALSILPGLGGLAYLTVMDEFDPYKYNSFATNAAAQVHSITRNVDRRIRALAKQPNSINELPPILVFKSTVDSTVTTDAVVDNLLSNLPDERNELVLFDINRNAAIKSTLLVSDPGPLTNRIMADQNLPFAVTFITNVNPHSSNVVVRHKGSFSLETSDIEKLDTNWPRGIVSLSHVALPFPPDDLLYGQQAPANDDFVFLGDMSIMGERGLLKIPADWLLRLRYNPFYPYLERRLLEWLQEAESQSNRYNR